MSHTESVETDSAEPKSPSATRVREGRMSTALALQERRRKQRAFLKLFRKSGELMKCLDAAGISDRQHYRWVNGQDAWYQAQYLKAREAVKDVVESELLARAVHGYTETTDSAKWGVTVVSKKSDRLLEIAARALLKDRGYGQDVNVSGRLEVAPVTQDATELRAERMALVRELLRGMDDGERRQLLEGGTAIEGEVLGSGLDHSNI